MRGENLFFKERAQRKFTIRSLKPFESHLKRRRRLLMMMAVASSGRPNGHPSRDYFECSIRTIEDLLGLLSLLVVLATAILGGMSFALIWQKTNLTKEAKVITRRWERSLKKKSRAELRGSLPKSQCWMMELKIRQEMIACGVTVTSGLALLKLFGGGINK